MKILKTLRKRGLALFLVLTMCMSFLPANALAAEVEAATHDCNADGWTCVEESQLICGEQEHTHDEACGVTADGDPACGKTEHTHGDACYESKRTHTEPSENVKLFLRAMKDLPQEITAETEAAITRARSAYDALTGDEQANASVMKVLPVLTAAEAALGTLKDAEAARVEAVKAFTEAVAALPEEITAEDEAAVVEASALQLSTPQTVKNSVDSRMTPTEPQQ